MAAQSAMGEPLRRFSRVAFLMIAPAALLTAACDRAAQTDTQSPARTEKPAAVPAAVAAPAVPNPVAKALIEAERVDASFVAIPSGVDDIPATSVRGETAQVAALRRSAEQAYRQEATKLHDKLLADLVLPVDAPEVVRSLNMLAKARDAIAARPWTSEQLSATKRALAATPHRQAILALSAAMAAPHFVGERALTVEAMAWGLDFARRGGPPPSPSDASDEVAAKLRAIRMGEDAEERRDAKGRDHALIAALLTMPAADIATLTNWYRSDTGKAAKDLLTGYFGGANHRAARWMLIDFLARSKASG